MIPGPDRKADWIVLRWGLTEEGKAAQRRGADPRKVPYPFWVYGHNYATFRASTFFWRIPAQSLDCHRYDMSAAEFVPDTRECRL